MNSSTILSKKFVSVMLPALLFLSTIFLFIPFAIYQGNVNEFEVPLTSILLNFLVLGLSLLLVLTLVGILLRGKWQERFISVLFMLGILVWIQANFLVWNFGLLDGQAINWEKHTFPRWLDGSLWIVLFLLSFLFFQRIRKVSSYVSIILISVQLVFLITVSMQKPEIWQAKEKNDLPGVPPEEFYGFSSKQNVIHFILDYFQSDFFQEIIDENPQRYYAALEGFTYFRGATGSFPTTEMSIPAIFSGEVYRNHIPARKFVNQIMIGNTINNVLFDKGYQVDLVMSRVFAKRARSSVSYPIPVPYGVSKRHHDLTNAAIMLDLALFRAAPSVIKKEIYRDQLWLFQGFFSKKELRLRYFSHQAFLKNLTREMKVSTEKPVYKAIHLMTSHPPIVVNSNCEYAEHMPDNRETRKAQAKCALNDFINFIDGLKSIGVYDSSLIILQADHGAGNPIKMTDSDKASTMFFRDAKRLDEIAGSALPLLTVKPPNGKGPLKISEAQVALTDIPDTISSTVQLGAHFKGRSVFDVDPNEVRERKFNYYIWEHVNWQKDFSYFDHLDEFIIKGNVYDPASWRLNETYYSPRSSYKAEKIAFGTDEAGLFKRSGWGANERDPSDGYTFNWTYGNSASLFLALPQDKPVTLTANIKSSEFQKPQIISIKVDNKEVGKWKLSSPWKLAPHSIVINPDPKRPRVSVVEFSFSECMPVQNESGPVAVLFESITLKESNNNHPVARMERRL